MGAIQTFGNWLFGRLSFCARVGAIIGAIVGFFFGLFQFQQPLEEVFMPLDILLIGLLLGFVGWVSVLLLFGVWMRYGIRAVALLSLLIALLTGIVIAYILYLIRFPYLSVPLGILIGILIGAFVCWILCGGGRKMLSAIFQRRSSDAN